jgi:hypothetical protein
MKPCHQWNLSQQKINGKHYCNNTRYTSICKMMKVSIMKDAPNSCFLKDVNPYNEHKYPKPKKNTEKDFRY